MNNYREQERCLQMLQDWCRSVEVPDGFELGYEKHNELMQYRDRLAAFEPNEVYWVLPQILIDYLEIPPSGEDEWIAAYDFLHFLNLRDSHIESSLDDEQISKQWRGIQSNCLSLVQRYKVEPIVLWLRCIDSWDWPIDPDKDRLHAVLESWEKLLA